MISTVSNAVLRGAVRQVYSVPRRAYRKVLAAVSQRPALSTPPGVHYVATHPPRIQLCRSFAKLGRPRVKKPLLLECRASVIPHPDKVKKGGEDAFFIASTKRAAGVADGVGGWEYQGVDPAEYSRKLMDGALQASERTKDSSHRVEPLDLLKSGYDVVSENVLGSSTACIVALNGTVLDSINLGDSGFMVVRDGRLLYRSKEQQHDTNVPYQLASKVSEQRGGLNDKPEAGTRASLEVQPGDLVVLCTDGVFDNLWNEDILQLIRGLPCENIQIEPADTAQALQQHLEARKQGKLEGLADAIAISAHFSAQTPRRRVPYGYGKLDDVTVVAALVVERTN